MGLNIDNKSAKWKADVQRSVDMYNEWFMAFAPEAFRTTRCQTSVSVASAITTTNFLKSISSNVIISNPEILPTLRMSTCPPIAVDRLIGLSGVSANLIKCIEKDKTLPERMPSATVKQELEKVCQILLRLLDKDIFPWLDSRVQPDEVAVERASTIIADRLCGSIANPIIRNAQEKRQLDKIKAWLNERGYSEIDSAQRVPFREMPPATYSFRLNVPVNSEGSTETFNIPVDAVIQYKKLKKSKLPLLIEAKSAGDFTNVNKRRKEEAMKMSQLRNTYGKQVQFILFLCGYFDASYLGYEAAEGIDWVWEHSIDDLAYFLK